MEKEGLTKYLSAFGAWALAFGCSVGWGAFVMPGTTFLPTAGPLGTALGIAIGAVIMFIIGVNYHYLMMRHPDSGGALSYTIDNLGYDHGFLCSWFLILVYVAVLWANATALTLIARYLFGSVFQFGFHYNILGYDVYFGEVLLTVAAIGIFGILCIRGKLLAGRIQTGLAVILFVGIIICFNAVAIKDSGAVSAAMQLFAPSGRGAAGQVISIVVLAPWAFVGFESISHSAGEFKFPVNKSLAVMIAALITGAISYILTAMMAAMVQPDGYSGWAGYIGDLTELSGIEGLPTFYAAYNAMGKSGVYILGFTVLAAIITGLVGNYIASSRLLYSMADNGILPDWFKQKNKNGTPGNALLFLMIISLVIPFLGRTAIGCIVDVTTVGATIVYAYTSVDALISAGKEGNKRVKYCGIAGIVISAVFFIYFMTLSAGAMSTESYLLLATWGILGFVYFLFIFKKDNDRRFGKSTVVWIGLLFLIFFTALMWARQGTHEVARDAMEKIDGYYETLQIGANPDISGGIDYKEAETFTEEQMKNVDRRLTIDTIIQLLLIVAGLAIMLCVYSIMTAREKEMEVEKIKAVESNKAKTVFLSNMSHDIRTPMNAIIGYTNLAENSANDEKTLREYLKKIKTSSHYLLALINDVLEMSRIESGKMDLELIPVDLKEMLSEVREMFSTQMEEKDITFIVDHSQIRDSHILCDKNRLNRVLLNLLSNAYKFTPEEGTVSVNAWQIGDGKDGYGNYELRVKDSGIGMSKEFAAKVFEAFERERTSTVSGIQGTGLGMAITKSIIDLMGGTIEVNTAPEEGTEFVIRLRFKLQDKAVADGNENITERTATTEEDSMAVDFTGMRVLLTEDVEINRELATMLLSDLGFEVEVAENGREALDKTAASVPGYYDIILMDIQMPVMGGYEAAGAIRALDNEELSNIPIVAMTANVFSEDVQKALDAGMNGHIAKPLDVNAMKATLSQVLSRRT